MSGQPWTKDELDRLRSFGSEMPLRQIARSFPNRSLSAVESQQIRLRAEAENGMERVGHQEVDVPANAQQVLEDERNHLEGENADLRKTARVLQRQLATAKAKTADLVEAVHEAAREAAVVVGAPRIVSVKSDTREDKGEVALLHVTDWQLGKNSETYNTDVARQRIDCLIEKVLQLTQIERAAHPVRSCTILLGGDMCEGAAIFPGQAYQIDSHLYAQLFNAAEMIETMIRSLATSFETIDVWTVFGNHGRLGRKGDYAKTDNIDQIIYRIVAERMTAVTHVTWNIGMSWYQIAPIGTYRALLLHGDQVKSSGGTPAFAIMSRANRWASGVIEPFTDMYMGHFHQPMGLPLARGFGQVFMTPSIESSNEYAKEYVSATGTPAQRLHFINPLRGRVTTERIVWLDDAA